MFLFDTIDHAKHEWLIYRKLKTRYPISPHTLFQDTNALSKAEKQVFEMVDLVVYLSRE